VAKGGTGNTVSGKKKNRGGKTQEGWGGAKKRRCQGKREETLNHSYPAGQVRSERKDPNQKTKRNKWENKPYTSESKNFREGRTGRQKEKRKKKGTHREQKPY